VIDEDNSRGAGCPVSDPRAQDDDDRAEPAGTDPDPRLTLANERTLLAWNRTALALVAGGLAVSQLLKVPSGGVALAAALALIAFGAFIAFAGYRSWQRNDRALRLGQPVAPSGLPRILTYGLVGFALAAAGLAVLRLVS
jgi:putative membrane protein